jgi:Ca2+-binding RTX toxin-like protein
VAIIKGTSRDDQLAGTAGNDTLSGGAGSDSFEFSVFAFGSDVVNGGDGQFDMLNFGIGVPWTHVHLLGKSGVTVDFRDGTATYQGYGSVEFKNIEGVTGSGGNDLLIANDEGISFSTLGGSDILIGGAGDDSLSSDWYSYRVTVHSDASVDDAIYGGAGNDWLWSGGGNDRLQGGPGEDTIYSGESKDTVQGGAGADAIHSGAGADIVKGGRGDDTFHLDWWDIVYEPGLYYSGPDQWSLPENARFVGLQDSLISGNGGTDTMQVGDLDLDLTAVPNDKIRDIEIIDLTGFYGGTSLTLNKADILDISSSTDTLTILGKNRDSVNIVGNFGDQGVSDGFHRYKLGAATLLVDIDITNVS